MLWFVILTKVCLTKIPHSGIFWETFQKVEKSSGLWCESTTSITWFKEKKTELIVSISTKLSLEVLHGLFAPLSQKFPEGKPSCNGKRLGWDSPDWDAQCFWDYCIYYNIPYIHNNPLYLFLLVDCKHSVCNFLICFK